MIEIITLGAIELLLIYWVHYEVKLQQGARKRAKLKQRLRAI
jgi:hypothetical protein